MGSMGAVWQLFLCRKFCILDSYCCMGSMTKELPLSARVIIALLSLSLVSMDFICLALGCVSCIELLFCCNVFMQSATIFW